MRVCTYGNCCRYLSCPPPRHTHRHNFLTKIGQWPRLPMPRKPLQSAYNLHPSTIYAHQASNNLFFSAMIDDRHPDTRHQTLCVVGFIIEHRREVLVLFEEPANQLPRRGIPNSNAQMKVPATTLKPGDH